MSIAVSPFRTSAGASPTAGAEGVWNTPRRPGPPAQQIRLEDPEPPGREDHFANGLAALDAYIAREGHARVPQRHVESGFPLGKWSANRRLEYRQGVLAPGRAEDLEQRDGWLWDVRTPQFIQGLDALDAYLTREGNSLVPQKHLEGDFPLGTWCSHRRDEHRRGVLDPERVVALEERAGWVWDLRGARFIVGLTYLDAYVEREGHAKVPAGHLEDGYPLGTWCATRRSQYRRGVLEESQAIALEARPGWVYDLQAGKYEEGLARLDAYVAREGHARVSTGHVEDGYPLGTWCATRRSEYRRGAISPQRQADLEARSGWVWDLRGGHGRVRAERVAHHEQRWREEAARALVGVGAE